MKFRPCIDIHNGAVKQIVGSSLKDEKDQAIENFISSKDASWYASLYRRHQLTGGHIILLNPAASPYYSADLAQARGALKAFPGGMQIGGGINDTNAADFLDMGASHVIVTSYIFQGGIIRMELLQKLCRSIGPQHLVLDLSCRRKTAGSSDYYIVTDRWQKFTDVILNEETFALLSPWCDEFLIHAVDVEGKANGIQKDLANRLGSLTDKPVTYAGGIRSLEDILQIESAGRGHLDFTVGSALDLFGGSLSFEDLCRRYART